MKKLATLTVCLVAPIAFISCGGSSGSSTGNTTPDVEPEIVVPPNELITNEGNNNGQIDTTIISVLEEEILDGINAARVDLGLTPLALDSGISNIARGHSANMSFVAPLNARPPVISHDGFLESRAQAVTDLGFQSVAENVAANRGFAPDEISNFFVQGWIDSPPHFTNLTGDYTTTGIGVFINPDDNTVYATQLFAR